MSLVNAEVCPRGTCKNVLYVVISIKLWTILLLDTWANTNEQYLNVFYCVFGRLKSMPPLYDIATLALKLFPTEF